MSRNNYKIHTSLIQKSLANWILEFGEDCTELSTR